MEHYAEEIFEHYNSPAVAAGYGRQEYITPCERLLFSTYIRPGMAILDIGVGGGRTSEYLARSAARYVGIDYAPEMVRLCRQKYPQFECYEGSAVDLSRFPERSFDAVIMSYNVLDDLIPDENRWRCLRECHRVLRDKGILIFSSHNPRAIIVRTENARRASHPAAAASGRMSVRVGKTIQALARMCEAICASGRLVVLYALKAPFWKGAGYMLDSESLMTHFWTPKKAIAELVHHRFRFRTIEGDDYPKKSHPLVTEWYYYVFQK